MLFLLITRRKSNVPLNALKRKLWTTRQSCSKGRFLFLTGLEEQVIQAVLSLGRVALSPSLGARIPDDQPLKSGLPKDSRSGASIAQKSQTHPGITPPTFPSSATWAHGPRLLALAAVMQEDSRIKHYKFGSPLARSSHPWDEGDHTSTETKSAWEEDPRQQNWLCFSPDVTGIWKQTNERTILSPSWCSPLVENDSHACLFPAFSLRSFLDLEDFLYKRWRKAAKQIFLPELCACCSLWFSEFLSSTFHEHLKEMKANQKVWRKEQ